MKCCAFIHKMITVYSVTWIILRYVTLRMEALHDQ